MQAERTTSEPKKTRLTQDELTWSALSHGSAVLNLFSAGFAGPLAAGIIYLVYKDRSRWITFHALQSLIFQLLLLGFNILLVGVVWGVGFAFSFATIGFGALLAAPVMIVVFFLAFIVLFAGMGYSFYAAYQVASGREIFFPVIANWIHWRP